VTARTVVCLDDDSGFLEDALLELEDGDWELVRCTTPDAAREALQAAPGPVLAVLDHDLGLVEEGYDVARWIRAELPRGAFVPVVYLTAKQTDEEFTAVQRSHPFAHPNLILSKRMLGDRTFDFSDMVEDLFEQAVQAEAVAEEQALRASLQVIAAAGSLDLEDGA